MLCKTGAVRPGFDIYLHCVEHGFCVFVALSRTLPTVPWNSRPAKAFKDRAAAREWILMFMSKRGAFEMEPLRFTWLVLSLDARRARPKNRRFCLRSGCEIRCSLVSSVLSLGRLGLSSAFGFKSHRQGYCNWYVQGYESPFCTDR
jgi:hypothetical protein